MKRLITLSLVALISSMLMSFTTHDGTEVTYIDMSGKVIYCSYSELPCGVYFEKTENGIRKIAKVHKQ